MEQGEVPVSATELGELRDGDGGAAVRQVVAHVIFGQKTQKNQSKRVAKQPCQPNLKRVTQIMREVTYIVADWGQTQWNATNANATQSKNTNGVQKQIVALALTRCKK